MSGSIECNFTARILQNSAKSKRLSQQNKQQNNINDNCDSNENNKMCISYITEMNCLKKSYDAEITSLQIFRKTLLSVFLTEIICEANDM